MHDSDLEAHLLPHIISGHQGGLHHAAHADQSELGVLHAISIDHLIAPPRLLVIHFHRFQHRPWDLVVIIALGDFALHVGVLILDDAGHDRVMRVEEAAKLHVRVAHELFHELELGQADIFDGVRREKAVLHVHERGLARLGGPPRDEREIACLLRVAAKEDAPAAIRHAHHVIVAAMDVERMAGQGAGADVEDNRQAFSGNRIEHLLHEDEALAAGKVGHPPARQREAFAGACGRVFGFGLDECQQVAPEILLPIGNLGLVARAHRRAGSDGISAGALGDVGIDPDDPTRAIGSRGG